jgi:hypothetical protein
MMIKSSRGKIKKVGLAAAINMAAAQAGAATP